MSAPTWSCSVASHTNNSPLRLTFVAKSEWLDNSKNCQQHNTCEVSWHASESMSQISLLNGTSLPYFTLDFLLRRGVGGNALNHKKLFSHSSGSWKSKIRVSADFSWGFSPGPTHGHPPTLCPHGPFSVHMQPWCLFVCPPLTRTPVRLNYRILGKMHQIISLLGKT